MNFHQWLAYQQGREDAIGALARQLLRDPISPLWSNRLSTYRSFLVYSDAESNFPTLMAAFAEWQNANSGSAPPIKEEKIHPSTNP